MTDMNASLPEKHLKAKDLVQFIEKEIEIKKKNEIAQMLSDVKIHKDISLWFAERAHHLKI